MKKKKSVLRGNGKKNDIQTGKSKKIKKDKMKKKKLHLYQLFIVVALINLTCGRIYHIRGKVVSKEEVSKSSIIELKEEKYPLGGMILPEARVILKYSQNEVKQLKEEKHHLWAVTDSLGIFEIYTMGPPGKQHELELKIIKEGYQECNITYIDLFDKRPQCFYSILAKQDGEVR